MLRLGTSAIVGCDRFIYNQAQGKLFFDVDGSCGAERVQIAVLSNPDAINSNNFVFVNSTIHL
ncbi:MAG TPA: hypothetical protein VK203_30740 [Nostocaceae cyanobacterium]|nr:hypothetical protein [Nostocaceae cyanobacterium]